MTYKVASFLMDFSYIFSFGCSSTIPSASSPCPSLLLVYLFTPVFLLPVAYHVCCFLIYFFKFVWVCMYAWVQTPITHTLRSEVGIRVFLSRLLLFLRQALSLNLELASVVRLTSQQSPESRRPSLSKCHHAQIFTRVLRIWTWVFLFAQQAFNMPWSSSPARHTAHVLLRLQCYLQDSLWPAVFE